MKRLELKVIPVVVFIVAAGLMRGLDVLFPGLILSFPGSLLLAALSFIASGYSGLKAIWDFRQAKTTVHPQDPYKASTVVSTGIYRYSRNPMYLGLVLLLICEGLVLSTLMMLPVVCGFILYMNRFQIVPEERALTARFGAEYTNYKTRVRRWI